MNNLSNAIVRMFTRPAPALVIVSGAGSTALNGTYIEYGQVNSKSFYKLTGFLGPENQTNQIWWDNYSWVIAPGLYYSNENVAFPWNCVVWTRNGGVAPAPTVIKG